MKIGGSADNDRHDSERAEVSAISHSYWTVTCDGPGCLEQGSTDVWELGTRKELRRLLRRDGWEVNVKVPRQRQRQDFCPAHSPRDRWRHRRLRVRATFLASI
ncbi:MAG TPA: hypothetical protein VNW50_14545 [Streptosporangiaceae bacterium]|nr:hypothetical protein [Streptosporangiaceae bacterium]